MPYFIMDITDDGEPDGNDTGAFATSEDAVEHGESYTANWHPWCVVKVEASDIVYRHEPPNEEDWIEDE